MMTTFKLDDYLEQHSTPPDALQQELIRATHLKTMLPRMLSGPVQGKFLELIAGLAQAERILEIGTFTGYSALSLAKGLAPGGKLITIEKNEEYAEIIHDFIARAGFEDRIELILGDALEVIPKLEGYFDLVFMDADKESYPSYYDLVIEKLKTGGLLLADNVLWNGKVLDPEVQDVETKAIRAFNHKVVEDQRVEQVLLPLRDGLMFIRKK